MKYFKDSSGAIFAFESDGSQDHLITNDMQSITEQEVADLTAPGGPTLEEWRASAVVTRRQAKQQLLLAGLLANVQPALDAIADDTERAMVQIYWDDAQEFERNHPELIGLGYGLGLTDEQIDDLFIEADKL